MNGAAFEKRACEMPAPQFAILRVDDTPNFVQASPPDWWT